MKKTLSFILFVCMLLNCVPSIANAKTTSINSEKGILEKLEILPKGKKSDDTITRYEFASSMAKILDLSGYQTSEITYYIDVPYTDEKANDINIVTSYGIMNGVEDGKFEPNSKITVLQAATAVINLLGYSEYAKSIGNYPESYNKVMAELKLTDGINQAYNSELTYTGMEILLSNALNTDMMLQTLSGGKSEYHIETGSTLLWNKLKIKKVKGVVKGNAVSAITEHSYTGIDQVNIEGEIYNAYNYDVSDFIGYYVTAYIKVDNNNENLIYIEKNASKTNEIIIDAKDFIKYSDKRIKYENSENGKTYTAQIESDVDVVFEGGPLSIYNEDTFKISDGNIRLIDNDNNGTYDVIFINPVQTMAVNSINYEKKFITDYFNNSRTLDLNDIEDKNITVVNQDGKDIKFTNIVQGNVITWSKDSKGKYYKIIVMQDAMIEGSITGVSGDDSYISVNDDIYIPWNRILSQFMIQQ